MVMHRTIEEHDANPPDTWQVVKVTDRLWDLRQKDGVTLTSCPTKGGANELRTAGHLVELWTDEGKWMRGEPVRHPWKPYAECQAEQARTEAFLARRAAERVGAASSPPCTEHSAART